MFNKLNIKNIGLGIGLGMLVVSCGTQQKYQRPADIVKDMIYRTDQLPADSTSIAAKSWKEIFTDTHLQGYISKALENNLDIRIAQQNIISAEAYLKQQKQGILPTLSVGANYSFQMPSLNSYSGRFSTDRTYINQFDLSASLSWEYNLGGSYMSGKRAQEAAYLSAVATHQSVKTDLVASVASVYYQLLALDEQKRVVTNTIELRNKNLEVTKALKEAGSLTEVAVKQSEAISINAESQLVTLDNQIAILENSLSILLGEAPRQIERGKLTEQVLPTDFALGYPAQLLSNRPDIMAAEYNLIQAFELTNVAKASFYPSLRLSSASGGFQTMHLENFFNAHSLFASVAAGILQPIFNKRQIKTQYEVSLANKEKAYLNFKKAVLTASQQVSNAMNTYTAQQQFISLKKKELETYKKAEEYSEELMRYGMANYLEVINASVNSLNAELNIVNAEYNQMKAIIDLYKALGGGWK